MTCPQCHAENREGRRFCAKCAAPLATACPSCGFSNEPGEDFCGGCAALLTVPSRPTEARFSSPQSYTPRHLAEKILTWKSALEGERKQVTVLFADLKGSMELLADRDPEEARKLLDPVLELMMEAVHRYEGTVNQVMGDGIMALFGAPLAHEDHAVRACYAALRMQQTVKRYAEGVRREQGTTLRIRVGLNSGEVVVRAIGSDLHMDYTAVGQTTHLAARMEQLADPGSILLTPETLALAEGFVQIGPLGPTAVRGLPTPIEVYELTGVSAVRSRLQATATRGHSRFVGRDAEMEQLRRVLEHARHGRGQVVAIVGEAGVGKSRLVWEVTHSHRTHGWLIVQAGAVSYGKDTPYLPVTDLLKDYFQIEDRDGPRKIREKVVGKLLTLDESLAPLLPALLGLVDAPIDDPHWQGLEPAQRRQRTLGALKRLLLQESQTQPLLVVLEDLHWIDGETQALLDSLVESLPTARMLLLVNYRPEHVHRWSGKTYYTQLRLDPLPPESTTVLLDALLGDDATLPPLKTLLVERTEGNPFFLEESVQTLVETKVLAGVRGAYRMTKTVEHIQVPATVHAMLAARIDRLPPEEKRLLQAAAVIGKDVAHQILKVIADEPDHVLHRGIAHLQETEFLYETRLFPDHEYTFKHALTQEVAYGSLLQEHRRTLHAQVVQALEHVAPNRPPEQLERLAHHAFLGEVWEKAVSYLRQVGTRALAQSANREAAVCFEQALVALRHLPETREGLEQAIDLRLDLRRSLHPLAEVVRMLEHLREAERLARLLNDDRRLGWVSVYLSHHHRIGGDSAEALRFAQTASRFAESTGDAALRVAASYYVAMAYLAMGDYRKAERLYLAIKESSETNLTSGRFGLLASPTVLCRYNLALVRAECGRFEEAIADGLDAVRLAEVGDHPYALVTACLGLGYAHKVKGDYRQSLSILERGRSLSRDWSLTLLSPLITWHIGHACALGGRVSEGLSLLQAALEAHEAAGVGVFHSLMVAHAGEVYALAGRLDEAFRLARRALTLARERRERAHEAYALRLHGDVVAFTEPLDRDAGSYYRQALVLADELGMRPLVAHCHLGLGKLYSRTGDAAKATEHLTTAATMYRETGMTFWLEKGDAELGGAER